MHLGDANLVIDLFAGPILLRALFRHAPSGPEFSERVTQAVLAGVGSTNAHVCAHATAGK